MKKLLFASVLLTVIIGCDFAMIKNVSESAKEKTPVVEDATESALTTIESVTGKPIVTPETASTVEGVAEKVATVANTGKGLAETGKGFLPEDKQPIADAAIGILGLLAAAAGAVARVMHKRATTAEMKTIAMTNTLVAVADKVKGGGEAVQAIAPMYGTALDIQSTYESKLAAGVVVPQKSTN